MIEEVELKGEWWLPKSPEEKVRGVLKLSQEDGLKLSLDGIFNDIEKIPPEWFNLVLGNTTRGKVTFCNPTMWSKSYYRGLMTSEFTAEWAFIGHHFNSIEEIKFKELDISYAYLRQWLNRKPFEISKSSDSEIVVKYRQHPEKKFVLDDGYCLLFRHSCEHPRKMDIKDQVTLKENIYVTIAAPEKVHFRTLVQFSSAIEIFLNFGIQKLAIPEKIWCTIPVFKKDKGENEKVQIYYRLGYSPKINRYLDIDCLFWFDDIADETELYLNNWIDLTKKYKEAISLYHDALVADKENLNRFLNLAQAIEIFHRTKFGGSYMAAKDFKKTLRKINKIISETDLINDEVKEIFRNKVALINYHTLKDRLKDIFEKYQTISVRIDKDKRKYLIQEIVETRNYYTHFDKRLEEKVKTKNSLRQPSEKLRYILEMMLLKEIGLSDELVTFFLQRPTSYHTENPHYRYI